MNPFHNILLGMIMLATGIGIPILAALNSDLGTKLGSAISASAIALFVAFSAVLLLAATSGSLKGLQWQGTAPFSYGGGLFMAFYLVSITWIAPKIGIGNAVFLVLLGQVISASMIDHYGLFGNALERIDLRRIGAIALMCAGLYLYRRA